MSDIYAGVVVPLPPPIRGTKEDFDPEAIMDYIRQLTMFNQELLYKMKMASVMPANGTISADTDETKFSHKMKITINGTDYYIMLTQT